MLYWFFHLIYSFESSSPWAKTLNFRADKWQNGGDVTSCRCCCGSHSLYPWLKGSWTYPEGFFMHMVPVLKQEGNLSVMHAVIIWSKHWLFIPVSTFQFAWLHKSKMSKNENCTVCFLIFLIYWHYVMTQTAIHTAFNMPHGDQTENVMTILFAIFSTSRGKIKQRRAVRWDSICPEMEKLLCIYECCAKQRHVRFSLRFNMNLR